MCNALRKENPKMTSVNARDTLQEDCIGIWSMRTILKALPDEAKNTEKQKAGRLRQKGLSSAAFSAAELGQVSSYEESPKVRKGRGDFKIKECESCLELLFENKNLKEALTKATVLTRAEETISDDKASISSFECCIPLEDVRRYLYTIKIGECWFNLRLNIRTGKVVAATVGRSPELEVMAGYIQKQ